MNDFVPFVKDAFNLWAIIIPLVIVILYKSGTLLRIAFLASFISIVERIITIAIRPAFKYLIFESYKIDPQNAVLSIVLMFIAHIVLYSLFATIFFFSIARLRNRKSEKKEQEKRQSIRTRILSRATTVPRRIGFVSLVAGFSMIILGYILYENDKWRSDLYDMAEFYGFLMLLGTLLAPAGILFYSGIAERLLAWVKTGR